MDVIELIKKEGLRRGLSPKTIKTYCLCVKRFFRHCSKEPRRVTKKDVMDYIDVLLENGACGNTLNVYLCSLKFLLEWILCKKVLLKVKYSKVPKEFSSILTKEEVIRLINSITNGKHSLIVKLMYSAGLRVGEVVCLRVKDFQFDKNYGWVRRGKGMKDRLFIVAENLKDEILDFINKEDLSYDSFVFRGRRGHLSEKTAYNIIKSAAGRAKIKKNVHPHILRHSFATPLIENGYDVASVQSLLGHNNAKTTMIYVHMASPRMISVRSPLDDLYC
jgi:site-specific recombinase XerD